MNRQQRRAAARKAALEQRKPLQQQLKEQRGQERDWASYNFGLGVAIEAIARLKGIGKQRKAEFMQLIWEVEKEAGINRPEAGDAARSAIEQHYGEVAAAAQQASGA